MIDLLSLNFAQLNELRDAITREIDVRRTNQIYEAHKEMQRIAKSLGMSINEVVASKVVAPKARKEAIYRHPDNAALSWSGNGRKPRWMHELQASGMTLDQLRNPEFTTNANA